MGQANRRGTFEERKAQAIARQQQLIAKANEQGLAKAQVYHPRRATYNKVMLAAQLAAMTLPLKK